MSPAENAACKQSDVTMATGSIGVREGSKASATKPTSSSQGDAVPTQVPLTQDSGQPAQLLPNYLL